MENKIKYIADHFGQTNQRCKLIEELGELIREISKDIAADCSTSYHTLEEIADVLVLIDQIIYLTEKDENNKAKEMLEMIKEKKINRTIDRIKGGFYEWHR